MKRDRPYLGRGTVRRTVHAGHGEPRILPHRAGPNGAGCIRRRSKAPTAPSVLCVDGEPVTVGRMEAMSKSERNTIDPGASSDVTAPIPPAGSSCRTIRRTATWSGPKWASPAHIGHPARLPARRGAGRRARRDHTSCVRPAGPCCAGRRTGRIAAVTEALESFAFNVAVARIYELANALTEPSGPRSPHQAWCGRGARRWKRWPA